MNKWIAFCVILAALGAFMWWDFNRHTPYRIEIRDGDEFYLMVPTAILSKDGDQTMARVRYAEDGKKYLESYYEIKVRSYSH